MRIRGVFCFIWSHAEVISISVKGSAILRSLSNVILYFAILYSVPVYFILKFSIIFNFVTHFLAVIL